MKQILKKLICVLICLAMVLPMVPVQAFAEGLVISITNEEEFLAIANRPSASYRLEADLNLGTIAPMAAFSGYLDGNGHSIRYSLEYADGQSNYGLFSSLSGAQISNLMLDCSIDLNLPSGYYYVAALAGQAADSSLANLAVNVTMSVRGMDTSRVWVSTVAPGGYLHSSSVSCRIDCAMPDSCEVFFNGLGEEAYYSDLSGIVNLSGNVCNTDLLYFATECFASVDLSVVSSASSPLDMSRLVCTICDVI